MNDIYTTLARIVYADPTITRDDPRRHTVKNLCLWKMFSREPFDFDNLVKYLKDIIVKETDESESQMSLLR